MPKTYKIVIPEWHPLTAHLAGRSNHSGFLRKLVHLGYCALVTSDPEEASPVRAADGYVMLVDHHRRILQASHKWVEACGDPAGRYQCQIMVPASAALTRSEGLPVGTVRTFQSNGPEPLELKLSHSILIKQRPHSHLLIWNRVGL